MADKQINGTGPAPTRSGSRTPDGASPKAAPRGTAPTNRSSTRTSAKNGGATQTRKRTTKTRPSGSGDALLRVQHLKQSYGDHQVLHGVDLTVRRGEVLGLIGANGAGKSTLAGAIAGSITPDSGEMRLSGKPLPVGDRQAAHDAGVAIIEQRFRLDPNLTVSQALFRHTNRRGQPVAKLRGPAQKLLIDVGIALDPGERLGDLTRSEVGMVEVVRLLADPRDLTIVDEVAASFNAREIDELREILGRLTQADRGVIYITHRLEEALVICDRVAVIREGVIVATLDSAEVTIDDLTDAMFGAAVEVEHGSSTGHTIALKVRGLDCGGAHPVNFDVLEGEIVGVLGSRAAGVGELIGGLSGDKPRGEASITVGDRTHQIASPREATDLKIAYLTGDDRDGGPSADEATARALMIGSLGDDTDFDTEIAGFAAILSTLRDFDQQVRPWRASLLSGGQTQWERIRDVVAQDARVLVLDDPTQQLDIRAKQKLATLLSDATRDGKAVLLVSSDAADLLTLTDRILVMADGEIRGVWRSGQATVADVRAVMRSDGLLGSAKAVDAVVQPEMVLTRPPSMNVSSPKQ